MWGYATQVNFDVLFTGFTIHTFDAKSDVMIECTELPPGTNLQHQLI